MSHPAVSLLMALLVSGASSFPGDRSTRERIHVAAYTFLTCLVSVVGGSWLMYFIHS
jgi:hypothetical protein